MDRIKRLLSLEESRYQEIDTPEEESLALPGYKSSRDTPLREQEPRRSRLPSVTWFIVLVITLVAAEWFITKKLINCQCGESPGRDTEFRSALSAVEETKVQFTGSIRFDEDGNAYREHEAGMQFTGKPSPEIDAAWDRIMSDRRYFWYTEEEARASFGENYEQYHLTYMNKQGQLKDGYMGGVEMFHSLHCLNALRMKAYPDYYPWEEHEKLRFDAPAGTHIDHCIDQLRQLIMCSGDLTPLPVKWWRSANISYVDTTVTHTCRNFEKIRDWVHARDFHDLLDDKPHHHR